MDHQEVNLQDRRICYYLLVETTKSGVREKETTKTGMD
jgi:hypothetical protein